MTVQGLRSSATSEPWCSQNSYVMLLLRCFLRMRNPSDWLRSRQSDILRMKGVAFGVETHIADEHFMLGDVETW